MLKVGQAARRHAALSGASAPSSSVAIRPLGAATRFSLRLRPADIETLGEPAGLPVDLAINRSATAADRLVARLGPDEWLIIGPEDEAETLGQALEAALGNRFHALVDISHRNVAIEVAGAEAPAVLNAGCPLDLDLRAFPVGAATRTLLGKAEIVLLRTGDTVFRVECWRSFATYVHGFLAEVSRDFP